MTPSRRIFNTIARCSDRTIPILSISVMLPQFQTRLIQFLEQDLALPPESVQLALRQARFIPNSVPMILWQYGLISLHQLEKILDWLETA